MNFSFNLEFINLISMDSFLEKSEKPTSNKLKKAKKRGEFAYSSKLATALFVFFMALLIQGSLNWLSDIIKEKFLLFISLLHSSDISLFPLIVPILYALFGSLIAMMLLAFLAHGLQSRFVFTWQRPEKRSSHRIYQGIYTGISWIVLSMIFYFYLKGIKIFSITTIPLLVQKLVSFFVTMSGAFLIISFVDYLFQRHFFYQDMYMTREEVEEEIREENVKRK